MEAVIKYLLERLSERTTWTGILAAVGVAVSATVEQLQAVGDLGVALAAALLIFGKNKWFNKAKAN